ncbi:hypothetical protein HQ590_07000 [bacterium]|nr:hypothetical protein [bacterium]
MEFDWILADFEAVVPSGARSREPLKSRWQIAEYTIDGLAGKMIYANPGTGAPPISIPLPLTGTYELVVAMREDLCDEVKIKLGSDRAFDRIGYSFRGQSPDVAFQEVPWRRVTLDGKETLVIKESAGRRLGIGFIAARQVTQPPPEFRKQHLVHLADDGYPGCWGLPEDDADAVWQIPAYDRMHADFLSYGCDVSGLANYPSRHPSLRVPLEGLVDKMPVNVRTPEAVLTRFTYRFLAENAAKTRNVPQLVFARARELGIKPLAYSRMSHLPVVAPYNAIETRLPRQHPEYRCIDIDGVPVTRLSMAFDEVRAEFLKLFTECVELGAAGISNVFVRGVPVVLYEQPVLDAFREKYGADLRVFPENDPRAQSTRAAFVTRYMREQRAAMNKVGNGSKITIAVSVPATGKTCDFYGLDIAAWVREDLVDLVLPYPFGMNAGLENIDLDFYCAAVKNSPAKLLPYVNSWRDNDPVLFLKQALRLCDWPIDGLSVWDPCQLPAAPEGWRGTDFVQAVGALGSTDAMRDCIERLEQHPPVRHIVRTQHGMKMDKYSYGWTY